MLNKKQKLILERKINKIVENNLRVYMQDWDDNILFMPTKIKMDYKNGNQWVPIDLSTEEFAKERNNPNYRLRNNSIKDAFVNFREAEPFFRDLKWAVENKKFAPSAKKFKEVLFYGNPFAINTARGHKPSVIKRGVKLFIDLIFSKKEKKEMVKNIINSFIKEKRFSKNFISKINDLDHNQIIDLYLDEKGEYYPVSSEEFGKKFNLDVTSSAAKPEHAKKVAISNFIKTISNDIKYWINSGHKSISFGFSDDDPKNIKEVEKFIRNQLSKIYPEIHFVIYDTSDNKTKKIVISKK